MATQNLDVKTLAQNIINFRHDEVMKQLEDIEKTSPGYENQLADYRHEEKDETLLHLITKYHDHDHLVRKIISLCPSLLTEARTGDYKGQTAFHIAISKQNIKAVEAMLENENKKTQLLSIRAIGSRFKYTVMMGELPLFVAALTFNENIVNLLIKNGAKIALRNSYDDTVFHCLVKYSACHPEKSENVIKMMKILNKHLVNRKCEKKGSLEEVDDEESDPLAVWFYPNYEKLTPLLLASKLGQNEIFDFILNLDDVYCKLQKHDGLFDIKQYDITEIDSVSLLKWFHDKYEEKTSSKNIQQDIYDEVYVTTVSKNKTRFNQLQVTEIEGALERICKLDTEIAIRFLKMPVIKGIVEKKWSKYMWYYYIWGFLHFCYMIGITSYTILRTQQGSTSENNQTSSQKDFVIGIRYLNLIIPVIYFLMEVKCLRGGKRWNYMMHHNGAYRFLLLLFSVTTFVDAVWYLIQPGSAYLIILSVLSGCWFLIFFLRASETFSFITVMLQQALLWDLVRFSLFLSIEFLSFTVVIHMLFIPTNSHGNTVEKYENFYKSMLSLFNVMLGLPELEVLKEASVPWLATLVQVLFIIFTYVLILNALIAVMSDTCSTVSKQQDTLWKVQTLSVILFIENILLQCRRHCSGEEEKVNYFDTKRKKMIDDKRYFFELDSFKPGYPKFSKAVAKEIEDKTNVIKMSPTPRENIDYEVSTIYI